MKTFNNLQKGNKIEFVKKVRIIRGAAKILFTPEQIGIIKYKKAAKNWKYIGIKLIGFGLFEFAWEEIEGNIRLIHPQEDVELSEISDMLVISKEENSLDFEDLDIHDRIKFIKQTTINKDRYDEAIILSDSVVEVRKIIRSYESNKKQRDLLTINGGMFYCDVFWDEIKDNVKLIPPNEEDEQENKVEVFMGDAIYDSDIKEENKMNVPEIKKILFNPPATIVFWQDGSKTVVKKNAKEEKFDPEKAVLMAFFRKTTGMPKTQISRLFDFVESKMKYDFKKLYRDAMQGASNGEEDKAIKKFMSLSKNESTIKVVDNSNKGDFFKSAKYYGESIAIATAFDRDKREEG